MTEPRCETVQRRLDEAFYARAEPAAVDRSHAEGCAACAAHRDALARLAAAFAADVVPAPRDALVRQTLRRAGAEVRRKHASAAAPPAGYRRELGRLVAFAVLPLPLVLAWNAAVLAAGGALLGWLPPALLQALGAAYVLAGATWLACLYGSLPLVAARCPARRPPALEVAP